MAKSYETTLTWTEISADSLSDDQCRKYQEYKRRRPRDGMQGVGPAQLTWFEFQDQADALGGCYPETRRSRPAMRTCTAS